MSVLMCMYLGGGIGATGRQPTGYVAPPVSNDNVLFMYVHCIPVCCNESWKLEINVRIRIRIRI